MCFSESEISGSHGDEFEDGDVTPCSLVDANRRFRAYCI
jgi:hypothetical protein